MGAVAAEPVSTGAPSTEGVPAGAVTEPEKPAEAKEKAPDAATLQAELATYKERTVNLEGRAKTAEAQAQKAAQDVEAAKRYVVQLVTQLQQTPSDPKEETEQFHEAFQTRPYEILDQAVAERLRPILEDQNRSLAQRERDLGRQAAVAQYGKDLVDRYSAATDEFMGGVPVQAQAKPGAWLAALKLQLLEHLDETLDVRGKAKVEAEKQAALEGGSAPARRASSQGLTDLEKRMAREFGMKDEEYLKHKKDLFAEES